MAGIMAAAAIAGMIGLRAGVQEETAETPEQNLPELAGSEPAGA